MGRRDGREWGRGGGGSKEERETKSGKEGGIKWPAVRQEQRQKASVHFFIEADHRA